MRLMILCVSVLALVCAGCGDDSNSGGAGTGGDGGSGGMGGGGTGGSDSFAWPPDATAYFDQYGILSADCATDEDCAMVLGYYHAFDRFVQMDIGRRLPTGRLADLVAPAISRALGIPETAARSRQLYSTRQGQPQEEFLFEQSSPKSRALLEAYSVGVNKWIADMKAGENGATFPREFTNALLDYTADDVPEWTPTDGLASIVLLLSQLTLDEGGQINAGIARELLGDDAVFSDLFSRRPINSSTILAPPPPAAIAAVTVPVPKQRLLPFQPYSRALPALERLSRRIEASKEVGRLWGYVPDGDIGSNNWVVSPSNTASGNALLSNDPHLGMEQPMTWYLAFLDAKTNGTGDVKAAGVTFPGIPWMVVGQTETTAWGVTTTVLDFSDVYLEVLALDDDGEPIGVMSGEDVIEFIRRPFTVEFNDGTTEEFELLFTPHHGPVREIDVENGTAITYRWTGSDADTDADSATAFNRATTVEEFRQAVELSTTTGQNFVVIDTGGNVGWYPYSRLPKRNWATGLDGEAPPWLPLDGASGEFEWTENFGYDELPQATNPAAGFIATANNDMTGALQDGDPTNEGPPFQTEAAPGYRHAQIVRLLEAEGDQHSPATMLSTVGDIHSLIGEEMTPEILDIANDALTTLTPNGQKVVNALEAWTDFECPTGLTGMDVTTPLTTDDAELAEASGCAAFHAALVELNRAIAGDERAQTTMDGEVSDGRPPNYATFFSIMDPTQLNAGDIYWDDVSTPEVETKYDVTAAALDTAGAFLVDNIGEDETAWAWGRIHGLVLGSRLGAFGIDDYNNPAPDDPFFTNDGGLFTVDVANPGFRGGAEDYVQTAGPSMRLVCEAPASGVECTIQLPGGQSSDIDSPNYDDLLPFWLENQTIPLVFDLGTAEANAVRTVDFNE
ncbi:MAG: penicillin acylase family protein [Polyangiales bacterium]